MVDFCHLIWGTILITGKFKIPQNVSNRSCSVIAEVYLVQFWESQVVLEPRYGLLKNCKSHSYSEIRWNGQEYYCQKLSLPEMNFGGKLQNWEYWNGPGYIRNGSKRLRTALNCIFLAIWVRKESDWLKFAEHLQADQLLFETFWELLAIILLAISQILL